MFACVSWPDNGGHETLDFIVSFVISFVCSLRNVKLSYCNANKKPKRSLYYDINTFQQTNEIIQRKVPLKFTSALNEMDYLYHKGDM